MKRLAIAALALSACTSVRSVPKGELAKLDGFRARDRSFVERVKGIADEPALALIDEDGDAHAFDQSTLLVLVPRDGQEIEQRYRAIDVRDGKLRAEPLSGGPLALPVADIESAGVRKFSLARTLGLAGGIAGALLTGVIIFAATVDPADSSGSRHHDWD